LAIFTTKSSSTDWPNIGKRFVFKKRQLIGWRGIEDMNGDTGSTQNYKCKIRKLSPLLVKIVNFHKYLNLLRMNNYVGTCRKLFLYCNFDTQTNLNVVVLLV